LLLLGACSSMPEPPGEAPLRYRDQVFDRVITTRDLEYGSAPGRDGQPESLRLDLYEPDADAAARRPVLIWAHGGGFSGGDKASGVAPVMATLFAKLGYVAISINYRLLAAQGCSGSTSGTSTCVNAATGAIHDGQAAIRWVRANAERYRLDPDRIGFGGESAGAIMATGVGVLADQPGDSGNPGYPSDVRGWYSISGGLPGGVYVDAGDAPGYLLSGTADNTVPYKWSVETAAAMRAAGVFVALKTLDGAGHVPFQQYGELFETQADYFFYGVMALGSADR
jgi:acetyl esterase/lipase